MGSAARRLSPSRGGGGARGRAARGPRARRRPGAAAERHGVAHARHVQGVRRRALPAGAGHHRRGSARGERREAHRAGDDARCDRAAVRGVDRAGPAQQQHRGAARRGQGADRGAAGQDPRHRPGTDWHAHRARLRAVGARHDVARRRHAAGQEHARRGVLPRAAAHLARRQSRTARSEAGAARDTSRSLEMNAKGLLVLLSLAALPATAAEVAGVSIDDQARVANSELVLNGAGLRKRFFVQVYAIGLYLPQKATRGSAVLQQQGPKRIAIHMLRDVSADTFYGALIDGLRGDLSEAEMKAIDPQVKQLASIMTELKEAKKGMAINLDWHPVAGTVMLVNGAARGKPIAGEEFYRALLRIWIGDKPVQDDLKKDLVGG